MKLTHVGVSHYRSIGPDFVMIDLTKKVTVLVGQNDGGKSNVLRGLSIFSNACRDSKMEELKEIDFFKRNQEQRPVYRLIAEPEESDHTHLKTLGKATINWTLSSNWQEAQWYEIQNLGSYNKHNQIKQLIQQGSYFTSEPSKDQLQSSERSIAGIMASRIKGGFPEFKVIPQYRRIEDTAEYSIEGKGIIKLLASWQHPPIGKEALELKFKTIEKLLRDLLERPAASLEVPVGHNEILVRDGSMRLPLESHGTGVHQLIVLAIAVLSKDNIFFGIEEPEIHLHPLLQRRFLQFLKQETTNRYVITTHSPALIAPSDDVGVVHLRMTDGITKATTVDTDASSLSVLNDLGIRPSDLLQANCVIWVEGPSDRIYLNHWLRLIDGTVREGVNYAIMFYGGRLLSHLSLERDDPVELERLIRLLRINQHSAVVIDSDRKQESDDVNATKKRIQQECESNGLLCWITEGREIENYIPERVLSAAWKSESGLECNIKPKQFEKVEAAIKRAFRGKVWKSDWNYAKHKTEWSRRMVAQMTSGDINGKLAQSLKSLLDFIRKRN